MVEHFKYKSTKPICENSSHPAVPATQCVILVLVPLFPERTEGDAGEDVLQDGALPDGAGHDALQVHVGWKTNWWSMTKKRISVLCRVVAGLA